MVIVEDDPGLRAALRRGLEEVGFRADSAATAAELLERVGRDGLVDRLSAFGAGGDDYVIKPFAFAEVVARLQALLRRAGTEGAIEEVGLRLDPVTHSVSDRDGTVSLTPTEFRLLARLLARPGEAVRRRDLLRAGWPAGAIVREAGCSWSWSRRSPTR